jgi:hypothetical protein
MRFVCVDASQLLSLFCYLNEVKMRFFYRICVTDFNALPLCTQYSLLKIIITFANVFLKKVTGKNKVNSMKTQSRHTFESSTQTWSKMYFAGAPVPAFTTLTADKRKSASVDYAFPYTSYGYISATSEHISIIYRHSSQLLGYSFQVLGRSFQVLGRSFQVLGHSSQVLGHSFQFLGRSSQLLGHSSQLLGHSSQLLGHSSQVLGHSSQVLGHSSRVLGHSSRVLGHSSQVLGHSSQVLGHSSQNCKQSDLQTQPDYSICKYLLSYYKTSTLTVW